MGKYRTNTWRKRAGYTLPELMIAVLIVGVPAAVAIPAYRTYQLRSKSAEAKTNLGAIRTLENSFYSENEAYHASAPEPPGIPGTVATSFDAVGSDFSQLGFKPEGSVYFSYGVAVSEDGVGFTADAGADIDGNGFVQFWGYTKVGGDGVRPAGEVGCNVAGLDPETVGPCSPTAARSVF